METKNNLQTPKEEKNAASPAGQKALKIFLPMAILGVAILAALYIGSTAPKAQRTPPPLREAPLVETIVAKYSANRVVIAAMGGVIPSREITLKPQVTGKVIYVNPQFTEGGHLNRGDELLRIDDQDYRLALAEQQSALASAEYELKLEMGHQDVAKREWELINNIDGTQEAVDDELALRKPHLEKAKADLAAAQAAVKQAELDLWRTSIRTPFSCIVKTKNVDLGSHISVQEELAQLLGTDEYRVRASVPVNRLKWISIPRKEEKKSSAVKILYGNGTIYERKGQVIKLLSDLEEEGRMARVMISVSDPLDLNSPKINQPPLLIGEYVRLEIEGPEITNTLCLPRSALREGENVWIARNDGTLDIRKVKIIWRDESSVLITEGVSEGENIITTDLSTPVQGMKLATLENIGAKKGQQN